MEYGVHELAMLAGVSDRTIRFYDAAGLLPPARIADNGYRVYLEKQVDQLQQILLYREMGISVREIGRLLCEPGYCRQTALEKQLSLLKEEKERVERLIDTVSKTLRSMKGEESMSDTEKFAGIKRKRIEENRARYGDEVVEKYGAQALEDTEMKLADMDEATWQATDALENEVAAHLKAALAAGDSEGGEAQKTFEAHKKWLCSHWKQYSPQAHKALAESYVSDERFCAYYERAAGRGAAEMLRKIICHFAV